MVKSHYYKHIFRSWHKSHNCATFFFNYGKCRTTRNYNYEIKVVLICLHSVEELKIRHSHVVTFHFILCWRVDSTRPTRRVWDHWSAWERWEDQPDRQRDQKVRNKWGEMRRPKKCLLNESRPIAAEENGERLPEPHCVHTSVGSAHFTVQFFEIFPHYPDTLFKYK